jgi:hypothetical protein
LELLSRSIPQHNSILLEGFWLSNNWRVNYEQASIPTIVDVDLKNLVIPPYFGPKNMRPSLNTTTYTPFHDFFIDNFVFVRHSNPIIYLV